MDLGTRGLLIGIIERFGMACSDHPHASSEARLCEFIEAHIERLDTPGRVALLREPL